MARLSEAGLRVVPTGLAHGTVTAISNHRPFEITTLRRDVSTDGRHAQVAWTDDWRADAARRDFTINAMSADRAGVLHDFFGGQADLAAGRVRFVGGPRCALPKTIFACCAFPFLRALRPRRAPTTRRAPRSRLRWMGSGSCPPNRVWSELKRILQAPDPVPALGLMQRLGVLGAVLPEGADLPKLEALVQRGAPADPLLRMAALLDGDTQGFARRLKLSALEEASLVAWRAGPVPGGTDADLRRWRAEEDVGVLIGRIWLADLPFGVGASLRARLARIEETNVSAGRAGRVGPRCQAGAGRRCRAAAGAGVVDGGRVLGHEGRVSGTVGTRVKPGGMGLSGPAHAPIVSAQAPEPPSFFRKGVGAGAPLRDISASYC